MTIKLAALFASLACLLANQSMAEDADQKPTIQNTALKVAVDGGAGTFSIQALPSGKSFVSSGKLNGTGGKAKIHPVSDKAFGDGEAIEVAFPDGSRESVLLFPQAPFALFRFVLHNSGAEPAKIKSIRPIAANIDLGKPAAEIRALGTDGLTAVDKNPGSYGWLALADPQSRAGVVGGWVSFDRGSGVVFSKVDGSTPVIEGQIDYGRLPIAPGKDADAETFALGYFDDARLGMEAWAEAIAKTYAIKLPPQPVGYCTWYHAGASNEKQLATQTEFAAKELAPFGFSVVQIDDGWQEGIKKNGPKKVFAAFNPSGPYPSGMKATAENIKAHGLTPGIWFMPFAGTHDDPFFKEHQDWFVKTEDGKPYDTAWGGTCIDMTNPGAREYLRSEIDRIAKDWGYQYFKMDGMWTGTATKQIYVNSGYKEDGMGDAVFFNPEKTNIEAYRDGLKLIRETAGNKVFILGCCVAQNMRSYGGAFGMIDAMRIGPDNGPDWSNLRSGPLFASRNYHLHGRVWYNDPDPVYVRQSVPTEHAQLICSWVAISGALNLSSELMPSLPAGRVDMLKRTMPSHGLLPRPVDLFENEPARMWLLTDERRAPRRDVVALYNWESHQLEIDCATERIGLPAAAEYAAFDYWSNAFLPPIKDRLKTTLPKESCQIVAVRALADHPILISTSRHITQGIVDVLEEKWDAASSTLSGKSKVVAADPYELRIVAFALGKRWNVASADVSPEDKAAGVKIAFKENAGCVRATIESATSREINWTLSFRQSPDAAAKPQAPTEFKAEAEPLQPVKLSWARTDGESYEISREGGKTFATCSSAYLDSSADPEKTYVYAVTAVDFAGNRSDPAKITFTTAGVPKPPALPPQPTVNLSDLKPTHATMGNGTLGLNKSVGGHPLTVNGKKYEKGLGAHAISEISFDFKEEYRRFVAVVGLDDEERADERPSVVFQVYADKKLLAESPKLTWRSISYWHFDVPLPKKAKHIRLIVTDAGDGIACDHADWVDAGFMTAEKN